MVSPTAYAIAINISPTTAWLLAAVGLLSIAEKAAMIAVERFS